MKKILSLLSVGLIVCAGVSAQTTSPWPGQLLTKDGGTFFVYNPATGLWLQGNQTVKNGWLTGVNVGTRGEEVTFINKGKSLSYKDQYVWNLSAGYYSGNAMSKVIGDAGLLYWDMPSEKVGQWDVSPGTSALGNALYPNSYVLECGDLILGASDNIITLNAEKNTEWQLVTKTERIKADSAKASPTDPVDMTYLIHAPLLGMRPDNASGWYTDATNADGGYGIQGSPAFGRGGDTKDIVAANRTMEFWCTKAIDFYQTITGLPNGTYKVSCRGYYRDGAAEKRNGRNDPMAATKKANGTETLRAYLYANTSEEPLMSIFNDPNPNSDEGFNFKALNDDGTESSYMVPNKTSEANETFYYGHYQNKELTAYVTDGTLRIGVRKSDGAADDWTVFSNFSLKYLGKDIAGDPTSVREALQKTIDEANTISTGSLPPTLAQKFTTALTNAQAAVKTSDISGINNANSALQAVLVNAKPVATVYPALYHTIQVCKAQNSGNDEPFAAAITAAQNVANTSESKTEIVDAIYTLENARRNFAAIKVDDQFKGAAAAAGKFYLYNVGAKRFLQGGSDWNTHFAAGQPGLEITLAAADGSTDKFTMNRQNGDDERYLNFGGYTDTGRKDEWTFTPVAGKEGVYNITHTTDGTNYDLEFAPGSLTDYGAENSKQYFNTVNAKGTNLDSEAAQWKLVTKAERDRILATATDDSPKDATYLLKSPGFDKFSPLSNWTNNSDAGDGQNGVADDRRPDPAFDAYDCNTIDLSQTVENLPAGWYTISFNGFYRDGTRDEQQAQVKNGEQETLNANFYVKGNDAATTTVPSISAGINQVPGVGWQGEAGRQPDDAIQAATYFECGLYRATSPAFEVKDGKALTFGIKKDRHISKDWLVVDNFTLTYYGTNKPTSINNIRNDNASINDIRYNLAGQRVNKNYKGVVIIKGKKLVVR